MDTTELFKKLGESPADDNITAIDANGKTYSIKGLRVEGLEVDSQVWLDIEEN